MTTPGEDASTDEVVAWLLGAGHSSCLDRDGRPLGERASPLYPTLGSNLEEHRLFGDVRDEHGLPCNIAALKQMHRSWPVLLSAIESFDAHRPATLHRTYRRAIAGIALGPLLALRNPAEPVPVDAAALYKVTLGFGELISGMLVESRADADDPWTDALLQPWLDDRPWLVGDAQVCAGARVQIQQVWRSLGKAAEGRGPAGWDSAWFASGLEALMELMALAACASGAARSWPGQVGDQADAAALRLLLARDVPRLAETLRQAPGAGVAHPSLLYPAEAVPQSVRRFVGSFADGPLQPGEIDALLEREAGPAAARLMNAVGRGASGSGGSTGLTRGAFLLACQG